MKIDYAVANYWRLKAIDSMQDLKEMSRDERHRIIKTIVGNDKTMQNILKINIQLPKYEKISSRSETLRKLS